MKFDILTIFPEVVDCYGQASILGRAQKKKLIKVTAHNFRDYTLDKHGHVDDRPFGGGPGMILQIQPIYDCLKKIKARKKTKGQKIIILDPAGKKFDQKMAEKFSKLNRLILIAGRYEGFDARIYKLADERVSVGDYVLAGGELAALTVVEAVARLIPGVLGNENSLKEETFNKSAKAEIQKEYPQYTRPENFKGQKVPKVLLSGDHKKIEDWRKKNSI
ncbi:MAG: tRNA (guanosine(37)-N1)-methyltransferase TrmD [Patescibacteria group bacterium]